MGPTEQLTNDIRDIKVLLITYFPFATIPMQYLKIALSNRVKDVAIGEDGSVLINIEGWNALQRKETRSKLLHVMFHILFMHYIRIKGFDKDVFNYTACAKVEAMLTEVCDQDRHLGNFLEFSDDKMRKIAKILKLDEEIAKKMSVEDLARSLEDVKATLPAQDNDFCEECAGGPLIQDGSDIFAKQDEQAIKQLLNDAKVTAQLAGNMPLGLQREIDQILEVQPPWELRLRMGISGLERNDVSYVHSNRRYEDYPGDVRGGYQLFIGIDTSGSITKELLQYFLGIVVATARNATVWICPWDAEAYEMVRARTPSEVAPAVAEKMKGGGGTEIAPFLEAVSKRLRQGDGVIILTDGDVGDLDTGTTKTLFTVVRNRSDLHLIGFTHTPVKVDGWQSFMIHGERNREDT